MTLLVQMALQGAVGFAIGAGTNDLAIRWIFNAVFSKKKKAIALSVQDVVSKELMSPEKIVSRISTEKVQRVLRDEIRKEIDRRSALAEGLVSKVLPGIEPVASDIKKIAAAVCTRQLSDYLIANAPRILAETDVWRIIHDSIIGYDEKRMEYLTRQIANRELHGVTLWGGVIGALVGMTMSVFMWAFG